MVDLPAPLGADLFSGALQAACTTEQEAGMTAITSADPSSGAPPPAQAEASSYVTRRRRQVVALRREGMTMREIGEIFGCSRTTILKDLRAATAAGALPRSDRRLLKADPDFFLDRLTLALPGLTGEQRRRLIALVRVAEAVEAAQAAQAAEARS